MRGVRGESSVGRRMASLAAAALLTGLAGCELAPPDQDPEQNPSPEESRSAGASAESTTSDGASPTGPTELTNPIEFRLVEEVADTPCAEKFVLGPDGQECFRLGNGMEITEVVELELTTPDTPDGAESGEELVHLTMTDDDGAAFADLTSRVLSTSTLRLAMVAAGEVVVAPQVAQEIHGGELEISAWNGAREFVAEATAG